MGRFKKPVLKTVKCEDCGRLFGKERDLTQHLNSKAHTSVIGHDTSTPLVVGYPLVTSGTPSFQPGVELPKAESATSKLYTLTPIPGKGQGLIAVQDIPKGTRILSEKPLFRIQSFGSELTVMEKEIQRSLNLLSKDDQKAFFALHNSTPGDSYPLIGIVKTNSISLGSGSSTGGIFLIISRINHSCRPNTQDTWNSSTGNEIIHAIRDIKKGEEITISYNLGGPSQQRMQLLKTKYGFDCTCALCSLADEARESSDARQVQIEFLDNAIGDSDTVMQRPGTALARCKELLSLYEIEAITDPRIARVYYDAFQICITHSDEARASVFAQKAYETRVYLEGEDSPDTQKMKSFMIEPGDHMAFGLSESWELSKGEVPRNVDAREFDRWLWLRANSSDDDGDTSSSFDSLDSDSIWRKLRSSFR